MMDLWSVGVMRGHGIARGGEYQLIGLIALLRLVPLRGTQSLRGNVRGAVESAPTARMAGWFDAARGGMQVALLPPYAVAGWENLPPVTALQHAITTFSHINRRKSLISRIKRR